MMEWYDIAWMPDRPHATVPQSMKRHVSDVWFWLTVDFAYISLFAEGIKGRRRSLRALIRHLWSTTKSGFDQASWIFWIIGGFAVIGKLFGLAGIAGDIVTLVGFYMIGTLHRHI
jgi:hypothetical protein